MPIHYSVNLQRTIDRRVPQMTTNISRLSHLRAPSPLPMCSLSDSTVRLMLDWYPLPNRWLCVWSYDLTSDIGIYVHKHTHMCTYFSSNISQCWVHRICRSFCTKVFGTAILPEHWNTISHAHTSTYISCHKRVYTAPTQRSRPWES
jgi:hypothetical protein